MNIFRINTIKKWRIIIIGNENFKITIIKSWLNLINGIIKIRKWIIKIITLWIINKNYGIKLRNFDIKSIKRRCKEI